MKLSVPRPGFAEQNPYEWWEAVQSATAQAKQNAGVPVDIRSIGVSGQMLGSVLMKKDGTPDPQCMIWMDQRATRETAAIVNRLGNEQILDITANFPLTSYWAPKILWLKANDRQRFSQIDKILFPKDYINYCLTGEYATDVTDATGTMLFDTAKRAWSPAMFDQLEIPRGFVADRVLESTQIVGTLTVEASRVLGIAPDAVVVAGGGDQMCSAVGLGVVQQGVVSSTIGTSGCIFSFSDSCYTDRQPRAMLSYCHSVPGTWCLFGCTLAAGSSYQWVRNTFFGAEAAGENIYAVMDELAEGVQAGSNGVVFLPYLNGERTPYPDPNARGVFFGLSGQTGLPEMCRAVLEGVTYSLHDSIEILRSFGVPVNEVRAAGGGAQSKLWRQIQADIYSVDIITTESTEAGTLGAAILAAAGYGAFPSVKAACDAIIRVQSRTHPNPDRVKQYRDYYQVYHSLYPALKNTYALQAEMTGKWERDKDGGV